MSLSIPTPGAEALLLGLVLGAAVYDVRYRKIPNWLNLIGFVLGVLLNTFPGLLSGHFLMLDWSGLWFSLKGFALAFAIYLVLYILHAKAAGDVKLMAALGSIVGWQNWFGIFIVSSLIGGLLSLVMITVRGRVRKTLFNVSFLLSQIMRGRSAHMHNEELDVRSEKSMRLPGGAVVALGTIFFLAAAATFAQ